MSGDALFTRDEVLSGTAPARRAKTLLYLIERRTAHLVLRSRQAMELCLTEEAARERELAFIEAFTLSRGPLVRPAIQDLERYAGQWAELVPRTPRLRAAVARVLAQRYTFTHTAVPGLRQALGLDTPEVQQAYRQLYREPLTTIYAPQASLADRVRWAWAGFARWLEELPPFWTAYALTLTETVGAGILALPIAVAGIGPLAGIAILALLGVANILTIAFMSEAVTRSGVIRYGSAFIGRAVADYLGRASSLVLTLTLFAFCLLVLQAYYIGFSTTLQDATHVPAAVWMALLFVCGLYYLRRESLNATIASALVVGAVNIGLILILSLLAFAHMHPANLFYSNVPLIGGRPLGGSTLALVFGVILAAYFGHLSVSNCGRVVLHRDPSGRSLLWGTVAAQGSALFFYSLFVLAINGAIAPEVLARESGTALAPLAAEIGASVHLLGSIFVILGMGMASIHVALALFNLTREWLPTRSDPVVTLARRHGRLRFRLPAARRGGPPGAIAVTYLGLDGEQPRFRLDIQWNDKTHRIETTTTEELELIGASGSSALLGGLPGLVKPGMCLALQSIEADATSVCLRVSSSLRVTYEGEWDVAGLDLADILTLPDPDSRLLSWITRRRKVTLADVAGFTGEDEPAARATLGRLVEQGFVGEMKLDGESRYEVRLAPRRGRQVPQDVWDRLANSGSRPAAKPSFPPSPTTSPGRRLHELATGRQGRFVLGATPIALSFLVTEWLVITGRGSFAGLIGFVGAVAVSILGGLFPVLLLIASRRKGEYVPTVVYRFLGHPLLLFAVFLLFLSAIFLHGVVIWQDLLPRAGALIAGTVMVVLTAALLWRGGFARRLTVELRADQSKGDEAIFAVTAGGRHLPADIHLDYPGREQTVQAATGAIPAFSSLRQAIFQLRSEQARELKVWTHRVTATGESESLPVRAEAQSGAEPAHFDSRLSGGARTLPLDAEHFRLVISVTDSEGA